jgi:3-isopropylmalate/(R)-2-methylmalate dehydratase small subunit
MNADMAQGLLAYMRRTPDGQVNHDFVLERPAFKAAPILIVGSNFGCGSSREHAVWAIKAFGIRCVIGVAMADFFRENCVNNGVLPISLELPAWSELSQWAVAADGQQALHVSLADGKIKTDAGQQWHFEIASHARTLLMEGLDDIGLSLKHMSAIEAWEARTARQRPFMQSCPAIST